MKIRVISTPDELKSEADTIDELADNSACANPFCRSGMLIPAFEQLRGHGSVVVLVWNDRSELSGVFPLEEVRGYRRFPVRHYSLWKHMHCFLATPLVRRGAEQETLKIFFSWLKTKSCGRFLFRFEHLDGEDAFTGHLNEYLSKNKFLSDITESYARPFSRSSSAGSRDGAVLSSKHTKDLRKKLDRLSELGTVEFEALNSRGLLEQWIESFLEIERSGWKGRADSAMGCDPRQSEFFRSVVRNAFNEGRLVFYQMTLGGRPIAMKCSFREGTGLYCFKIAYDEAYAKYSPGLLLEMEHLRYLKSLPGIEWIDSCALPGHPMLSRLMKQERQIRTIVVGTDRILGNAIIWAFTRLKRLKDGRARAAHPAPIMQPLPEGRL